MPTLCGAGYLIRLDLRLLGLTCPFPPEVADFTRLKKLFMQGNAITVWCR